MNWVPNKYKILYSDETRVGWGDGPVVPTLPTFKKIKNFHFLWWEVKMKKKVEKKEKQKEK